MSRFDFKLPDIGEGVMEGEIVRWLVRPGDAVAEDQPMVEVMTDKATVTITSPKTGKVVELGGKEGAVIPVHTTLVVIELSNGQDAVAPAQAEAPARKEPVATAVGEIREELPGTRLASAKAPVAAVPPAGSARETRPLSGGGPSHTGPSHTGPSHTGPAHGGVEASVGGYFSPKPLATPATRKLARDLGVDLRTVAPSGSHGRVIKEDVQRAATPSEVRHDGVPVAPAAPMAIAAIPDREVRTPLRGMRKRIFESMARSKHTAAHFTFVEECDVSALKELRARLAPAAAEQGVKLSYLPFFVKAVVAALKRHPSLNAAFDEATQEIVERRYYNIGIASATDAGLMVPVIHGADALSILGIAREIARLAEATKSGRVAGDDLRGSTFTITSLGAQGGLFATPILNMPEVGILGIHQMKQKPVVRDGQIVIGDVMLLSLSFDHRIIDGHVGAAFAYELIAYIEHPDRLWLELV